MTNENVVNTEANTAGFYGLGIAPKLLAALDKMQFKTPTPIQHQAIPIACQGKDLAGVAQTGTGKTIAFAIPMIQLLAAKQGGKGLVLVPTRELALQVNEVYKQFAPLMNISTAVLIGGESIHVQKREIRRNPTIIVATPGRLIDHLDQGSIRLDSVCVLVLDEADRMLDMGFAPQIERILRSVPKERQTMIFSATMPEEIMKIAGKHMKLPVRVEVARSGTSATNVIQEVYVINRSRKSILLAKLLAQYQGSVLLFSRTKHNAGKIARDIRDMGHTASEIHSNRSLSQRREALEGFKTGKYRILVATDIAARGIDVTGIELVINYDLPDDDDNYVHRIGRTGRAGCAGRAISLATPDQGFDIRNIERLIRKTLPIVTHPDVPADYFNGRPSLPRSNNRGGSKFRNPNNRRDEHRRPEHRHGPSGRPGPQHQHGSPTQHRHGPAGKPEHQHGPTSKLDQKPQHGPASNKPFQRIEICRGPSFEKPAENKHHKPNHSGGKFYKH